MTDLFAAVCSIAATRRRRYLWAAWWTGPPTAQPFRAPDAHRGGARTREEALAQAEQTAGVALGQIEPKWARAWTRILVGEAPWRVADSGEVAPARSGEAAHAREGTAKETGGRSVWSILGVAPRASPEELKRAFRERALETHPDQGGDAAAFREVHRAYTEARLRRTKGRSRSKA